MTKNNIASARASETSKLANEYTHNADTAKKLMNRFYRICGALNRLLILENTEATCNAAYTQELNEKTEAQTERLKADFEKYGLTLVFYGFLPTITDKKGNSEKISTFFY